MRTVVMAVFLVGCGAPPPSESETAQLSAIVWRELLGQSSEPPPVEWVGDGGPCLDEVRDVCADGTFDGHRIRVRWPGAVPPSAFAHEHIHAWLLLATGDGDAAHARGPWFMEARINDVLHARGF